MKASPVEGIGHEGEGDQVHSQVVIIQVQGLLAWEPGTSELGFSIDPHSAVGVGKQIPA